MQKHRMSFLHEARCLSVHISGNGHAMFLHITLDFFIIGYLLNDGASCTSWGILIQRCNHCAIIFSMNATFRLRGAVEFHFLIFRLNFRRRKIILNFGKKFIKFDLFRNSGKIKLGSENASLVRKWAFKYRIILTISILNFWILKKSF